MFRPGTAYDQDSGEPGPLYFSATGEPHTVTLAPTEKVVASESEIVPATEGGQTIRLTLAEGGDVMQLVTEVGQEYDFSG